MKILLTGLHSGWMGLHLSHLAEGLRRNGAEVIPADYHVMGRFLGFLKGNEKAEQERRDRSLERIVRGRRPDAVLFAGGWNFDLLRLKSYFSGVTAVYDYDGPRRRSMEDFSGLNGVDRFFSVSNWLCRELNRRGKPAHYLPHGVDPNYYIPVPLSARQRTRYGAQVSFIGRATPRRAELCSVLKEFDLALYGKRWKNDPDGRRLGLTPRVRYGRDVAGKELVWIYSASGAILNLLQEPLNEFHTILSIQAFAVPSSGGCLISEWVEELPEAFEDGREVLSFRSADELKEVVGKCVREPELVRKIGAAGRKRCLSSHTWDVRAAELLKKL